MIVVVDTNILVSAVISVAGNAAKALNAIALGQVLLFTFDAITVEYQTVLSRPKSAKYRLRSDAKLDMIASVTRHLTVPPTGFRSSDPGDTVFLDCAVAASADVLITGNKRHFPQRFYAGTEALSARETLSQRAETA